MAETNIECPNCDGTGESPLSWTLGDPDDKAIYIECSICKGTGKVNADPT